jgi:hypothetical protein
LLIATTWRRPSGLLQAAETVPSRAPAWPITVPHGVRKAVSPNPRAPGRARHRLGASPVEPPFDRERPVRVPDVAEVETLVTAVSAGANDAEVATAAVEFLRAQTAH